MVHIAGRLAVTPSCSYGCRSHGDILLLRALSQVPESFSSLDLLRLMLFVKVSSINYNVLIPDRDDDRAHIHELLLVRFDLLQIEWILKCLREFFVASNVEVCNPIEVS